MHLCYHHHHYVDRTHFHCHCPPHMPSHQTSNVSLTINVYNPIYIQISLVIKFFPNKCLGHLVSHFCPCVVPLMSNHVVVTSFGPEGCGGDIGSPFCPLNLLINLIKTTICWPIQMLPFNVHFKYVLKGVVLKLDLWAWSLLMGMILHGHAFSSFVSVLQRVLLMLCCGCYQPCNSSFNIFRACTSYMDGRFHGKILVNSIGQLFMWLLGGGDRFLSPMLLPSMWPTFSTVPKSIIIVIIMLPIGKFAFCASWNGSKFRPSQYPSPIKNQTKITSFLVLGLVLNSYLSTNVYGLLGSSFPWLNLGALLLVSPKMSLVLFPCFH